MISIDMLMDMIYTEGIDGGDQKDVVMLPPIRYDLELIEKVNGVMEWVEESEGE
jgi:hypothetical protein